MKNRLRFWNWKQQGTVFEIDNAGNYSVIYSFGIVGGGADGKWPTADVIMDHSGNLLGTTSKGGAFNGGLAIDANGNLYGTTLSGGAFAQQGIVFKIDNAGNYSVLHSFNGNDGTSPAAGVIVGADGNIYGTCSQGGPGNGFHGTGGTVWKLSLH